MPNLSEPWPLSPSLPIQKGSVVCWPGPQGQAHSLGTASGARKGLSFPPSIQSQASSYFSWAPAVDFGALEGPPTEPQPGLVPQAAGVRDCSRHAELTQLSGWQVGTYGHPPPQPELRAALLPALELRTSRGPEMGAHTSQSCQPCPGAPPGKNVAFWPPFPKTTHPALLITKHFMQADVDWAAAQSRLLHYKACTYHIHVYIYK